MLLQLDFLQFEPALRITKSGDTTWVFDPIRRKQIVLTPEELLRQLVLLYLLEVKKYPSNRIRVEIGLLLNERPKRCDLVVFDAGLDPWLVVECKSPKVPLTQATFEQVARYNLQFKAPFLAVTNGLATFSCALDFEQPGFSFLEDFPEWGGRG
ncbi:MAG: type I restriction enzyme HsdR N-terminal domain-containing protein [Thermoanaerobaculia bacterium]|nr:type I restriction enzyme HsdR N-terminal domain-containing protein [Thermoanaerobaculia bacterium]